MFSIVLESVCVLPQLLLLRQTTVPTVIDSYYLLTLGSYRAFYILNWIWRALDINDRKPDPVSIVFGVIQTAFYIDFAWVYYSRQRVKLRNGGVVDNDDFRNSWILRKIFGSKAVMGNQVDEESEPALGTQGENGTNGAARSGGSKWGARGISVRADDGILEDERARQGRFEGQEEGIVGPTDEDPDATMKDPDELAKALDEDDASDNEDLAASSSGVTNGAEWRDGQSK